MLEVAAAAASDSKTTIAGPSVRADAAVFFVRGFTAFTLGDSRFVTMLLPPGLHAINNRSAGIRDNPTSHTYIAGLHTATQLPDHFITPRLAALNERPSYNGTTRNHDRVFSYLSHIKSCVDVVWQSSGTASCTIGE